MTGSGFSYLESTRPNRSAVTGVSTILLRLKEVVCSNFTINVGVPVANQ